MKYVDFQSLFQYYCGQSHAPISPVTLRMIEKPFRIRNSSGDVITGDLRYVDDGLIRPVLVVCHGFTAHKDWGPFPFFGKRLAALGFATIVFNFSHNGIGDNFKKFTEYDRFSRNTIGKELEDLRGVINAIGRGELGDKILDRHRIGLVGHSRGSGVAMLYASLDDRVRAVTAWSTVATFFRHTPHQREMWEREGYLPVTIRSMRTKLRYGIEVLRDLEANREKYDLVKAVKQLRIPLLLVHGEADVSVKPAEAERLFEASDKSRTELIVVPHVGHMFGVKSGSTKSTPAVEHITELTAKWFHVHF
jgi:pimeloyl-ACP methyl ester carboxylesterase